MQGYIQINREEADRTFGLSPSAFKLFWYLLLSANFADRNGLSRGQGAINKAEWCRALKLTSHTVRSAMDELVGAEIISVSDKTFTVTGYESFLNPALKKFKGDIEKNSMPYIKNKGNKGNKKIPPDGGNEPPLPKFLKDKAEELNCR